MPDKIDVLIKNASQILTCASDNPFSLDVIKDGYVAVRDGKIISVGKMEDVGKLKPAAREIGAAGKVVSPGFVDCHTHFVFGGSRVEEYTARLTDNDTESLRKKGVPVGIRVTVDATRDLPFDDLLAQSEKRLQEMIASGTTTVESKSGYGFTTESEIKMLKINKALEKKYPVSIVSTFLGAHGWPPEMSKQDYMKLLKEKMFPAVAEQNLAEFCDIWCDEGYYSALEARELLGLGETLGMKARIHAEAYSWIGGSDVAAEMKMSSSDHLNYTPRETLRKLASAGVVGVLLPAIEFAVKHPNPFKLAPMLEEGLCVALATNCCPGCWCNSMQFVMALACRNYGMTPETAIKASTRNAAKALNRLSSIGTIEAGKNADIQIWNVPRYEDVVYRLGGNVVETVLKNGR